MTTSHSSLLSTVATVVAVAGLVLLAGFVAVVVWDCVTYLPIMRRYFRTLPTNLYGRFFGLVIIAATVPFWCGAVWWGALSIALLLLVLRFETRQYMLYLATLIAARQQEIEAHGVAQRGGPEAQPDLG